MLAVTGWLLGRFLGRTDTGVAIRASADSSEPAVLLGVPIRRMSTVSWALAGAMGGLATTLRAPAIGLVPGGSVQGPGLLLRALAVAVVASFVDIPLAVAGALVLGAAERALSYAYSGSTIVDVMLVGVIVVILLPRRAAPGARSATGGPVATQRPQDAAEFAGTGGRRRHVCAQECAHQREHTSKVPGITVFR